MSPKFQVYKDAASKTRFRLRADNGKIVAVGEAYKKYPSALNGIKSIQKNANSPIEDLTIEGGPKHPNPKYQIFQDAKGKFRFHLKAANGEIIAHGEGYESKESCMNGIDVVKHSTEAEIEDPFAKTPSAGPEVVTKTEVTAIEEAPKPQPPMVEPVTPLVEVKPEVPPSPEAKMEEMPKPETQKVEPEMPVVEVKPEVLAHPEPKIEEMPKTEPPMIETVPLPEAKPEIPTPAAPTPPPPEIPAPTAPTATTETMMPEEVGPVDTTLDLNPVPESIPKGTHVTFKGKLHGGKSDKGISGAKIHIWERDSSILGDDYLAYGTTGDDGTFNIDWHARGLSWRKKTGAVYAKFNGNEKGKPAKSSVQTLTFQ
jgi:uncharacterized protein